MMMPSESTHGRTGQVISLSGAYRALCCGAVRQLTAGESFPKCPEHGETEWDWIPPSPFVQNDWGTAALVAHWRHLQSQWTRAAIAQTLSLGQTVTPGTGEVLISGSKAEAYPGILLQAAIIVPGNRVSEGVMIEAVGPAWFEIIKQLERDPKFLYRFSDYDREFEELIAGAYEREGWPEVILTPRRGDKGRDVIASKPGFGSVRFIDQVKAYSPNHFVTADDVRALIGVLTLDQNVSKGVVTTTSQFAPGIEKDENIKRLMPFRLELRDGKSLCDWLLALYKPKS
jgi:restriction system protein